MDPQMKKGVLEPLVLAILKEGDTYGYELSERVAGIVDLAETALYPVLRRLQAQGMLETYAVEHNGRLRKYYRITESGRTRWRQYVEELSGLERVIRMIARGRKDDGGET
jgi:PadR family transcriptional regulator PadR